MKDREFLHLVHKLLAEYSYPPSDGVMMKLRAVAEAIPKNQDTPTEGEIRDTLPTP